MNNIFALFFSVNCALIGLFFLLADITNKQVQGTLWLIFKTYCRIVGFVLFVVGVLSTLGVITNHGLVFLLH